MARYTPNRPVMSVTLDQLSDNLADQFPDDEPLAAVLSRRMELKRILAAVDAKREFYFRWLDVIAKNSPPSKRSTPRESHAWELRTRRSTRPAAVTLNSPGLRQAHPDYYEKHRALTDNFFVAEPDLPAWKTRDVVDLSSLPFPSKPAEVELWGLPWQTRWDQIMMYDRSLPEDFALVPPESEWMPVSIAKQGYEACLALRNELKANYDADNKLSRQWLMRAQRLANGAWDGTECLLTGGWVIRLKARKFNSKSAMDDDMDLVRPFLVVTPERTVETTYIHYTTHERVDIGNGRYQLYIGGEPDEIDGN